MCKALKGHLNWWYSLLYSIWLDPASYASTKSPIPSTLFQLQ